MAESSTASLLDALLLTRVQQQREKQEHANPPPPETLPEPSPRTVHADEAVVWATWLRRGQEAPENFHPPAPRTASTRPCSMAGGHTSRINSISQGSFTDEQQITTRSLIRGLAHEVKNPLGGIRGAAQLLERALPETELREYTHVIISEADRLRDLVDRMLGPWQPMQFAPVNLIEALERVIHILQGEFYSDLQWQRDYDPSLPEVQGSKDQLIQAILNIARNACQALQQTERARIVFKTRVVRQFTIGSVRHKQIMHLSITDNGPGIPEDLIDRVFFPMISGRSEGSGLGLSISQNIVGQHGGTLQVASRPGNTTFSVYLPFSGLNQLSESREII